MEIIDICHKFNIQGNLIKMSYISKGHINSTFKVTFDNNKAYVIQMINDTVFKHPDDVMNNIALVTNYLQNKISTDKTVLHFLNSINNVPYYIDNENHYWRCYEFVENSIAIDDIPTVDELYQAGLAFGEFVTLLADINIGKLRETISDFHNTIKRYELLEDAYKNNRYNRNQYCEAIYQEIMSLKNLSIKIYEAYLNKEIPLRVTHNDTKCNNVLLNEKTKKYLCVIDLDTIMPGLVHYDFGDSIRSGCSLAKEDEIDESIIKLDMDKFKVFTKGYLEMTLNSLTKTELDLLYLAPFTDTVESAVRFLTDYLNNDVYFKTLYPTHNLTRAKNQLLLAKDILNHHDEMNDFIKSLIKQ